MRKVCRVRLRHSARRLVTAIAASVLTASGIATSHPLQATGDHSTAVAWDAAVAAVPEELRALRGLQEVRLELHGFDVQYGRYGLDRVELEAAIRERLQAAGLREDGGGPPARLRLSIRLNLAEQRYYSYGLRLALLRPIALVAEDDAYIWIEVWSDGQVGAVTPIQLPRLSRFALTLIDAFVSQRRQAEQG